MNREIYEQMAKSIAAQMRDILSSSTYDESDEMMDILSDMMMNSADDGPMEQLEEHIMKIYSRRIEEDIDAAGIGLMDISLSSPSAKEKESDDSSENMEISMDDFLFSL